MSKNNNKVIYDILREAGDLRYLFEYGLDWDSRLTKIICGKTNQSLSELNRILKEKMNEELELIPLKDFSKKKRTSSVRKLVKNNGYQLDKTKWYRMIYHCYGFDNGYRKPPNNYPCKEEVQNQYGFFYEFCTNKRCEYQRNCRRDAQIRHYKKLCTKRMKEDERDEILSGILENQSSIVEKKSRNSYQIRENSWSVSEIVGKNILSEDGYERFLEMIDFFADFTPLSVLGDSFLLRLQRKPKRFIYVRNQIPEYGLNQERMYRCLYAIRKQFTIFWNGVEYTPLRLIYRDKDAQEYRKNLYLEALSEGRFQLLPIWKGGNLILGRKAEENQGREHHFLETIDGKTYVVDFLFNDEAQNGEVTQYLEEKRNRNWTKFIKREEIQGEKEVFSSPYHPKNHNWKKIRVTYEIPLDEKNGFFDYIRSYGDFARPHFDCNYNLPQQIIEEYLERGRVVEDYSLCNAYNSFLFFEELAKEKQIKEKQIFSAPTKDELLWLDFILEYYPNMCQVFLEEQEFLRMKDRLKAELQVGIEQDLFCEKNWDFRSQVKDCSKNVVGKYRLIYFTIRKNQLLKYAFGEREDMIYPYAMEFSVLGYLMGKVQYPFQMMCYNLQQKRNLLINYKNIRVRDCVKEKEEVCFTKLEQVYHGLSLLLRAGFWDCDKMPEEYQFLVEKVLKKDMRSPDNYERCILKKLKKNSFQFEMDYEKLVKLEEDFAKSVFGYIEENFENLSENHQKYQVLMLHYMLEYVQTHKKRSEEELLTNQQCWDFIAGECKEELPNEITFFNDTLKNKYISFSIKEINLETVSKIYQIFQEFSCVGEWEDGTLRITVVYESFKYRRIHELMMIVWHLVEDVRPKKDALILQMRT